MLLAQLARGLDRRMGHVAGRMILEEVVADMEATRRFGQSALGLKSGLCVASKALRALQHVSRGW